MNNELNTSMHSDKEFSLTYTFSSKEIALLAKFLREKENEVPAGLENLTKALEDSVYKCLSLEEVSRFYS